MTLHNLINKLYLMGDVFKENTGLNKDGFYVMNGADYVSFICLSFVKKDTNWMKCFQTLKLNDIRGIL